MKKIAGISASAGLALGTARWVRHAQDGMVRRQVRTPKEERETFEQAARRAQEQLMKMEQTANAHDREIYMVHRVLIDDAALRREILSYIEVGASAAAAVERAAGIFARQMRELEDPYMRERACDILDACGRIVKVLDDQPQGTLRLTGPAILVSDEIYPTDIATLDRSLVMGFLTSAGSAEAHAAIIARMMGIPAVVRVGEELLSDCDGHMLALNGDSGEAYLDPDEPTKARFSHKLREIRRHDCSLANLRTMPCRTRDGTLVTLLADCASAEDVRNAMASGADGVGLLIGEYLMEGYGASEEKQLRFYRACLEAAQGKTVTVCLFDGTAQRAAVRGTQPQANPALGLRGARYCLAHPDFFETQLCALLRAGTTGNLRILAPMVSSREELERVFDAIEHAKRTLRKRADPFAENVPVGVMIETPAAALMADEIARRAAFFHMDTGTLAQYTFAADRADPRMRSYLPASSPAVYRLLRSAVEAAAGAQCELCLCGDNAAKPALAETYVRMGVRTFALPVRELLAVKEYLMGVAL